MVKEVGAITSVERGEFVTVAPLVTADGRAILPTFIFPRKIFKNHFINGGPVSSTGVANSSGWMTECDFATYIRQFSMAKLSYCSNADKNGRDTSRADRPQNSSWCICRQCHVMPTAEECVCCRE